MPQHKFENIPGTTDCKHCKGLREDLIHRFNNSMHEYIEDGSGRCAECLNILAHPVHNFGIPTKEKNDPVNHPAHYTWHPTGIESIEIAREFSYNTGVALAYIWRHLKKGAPVEDLKKAVFHLNDEIEKLSNESEHELEHAKSKKE